MSVARADAARSSVGTSREPVLAVRDLAVEVRLPSGWARVVDGVSFAIGRNEVLGIVGESGSGKSITVLALMGLLPAGRVRVVSGEVRFEGRDLLSLPAEAMRRVRGRGLAMIFQDPMTSLNPVLTIGRQIGEIIQIHAPGTARSAVRRRVVELLGLVGVPDPERRARQYPHEFSGGMRQRAMIAMAIANEPAVLIADEPTTALDVTIQAQIMDLLAEVRARTGAATILITHDLGLVAGHADRVAVMYGGRLVEAAPVAALFRDPRHPYSIGLMASLPRLEGGAGDLVPIPGQPPSPATRPPGCVFAPRCGMRDGRAACDDRVPDLEPVAPAHLSACLFPAEAPAYAAAVLADARP